MRNTTPELLSTFEAAKLLGVHANTVGRLLNEGKLPYIQPNKHRRIPRAAVETLRVLRSGKSEQPQAA